MEYVCHLGVTVTGAYQNGSPCIIKDAIAACTAVPVEITALNAAVQDTLPVSESLAELYCQAVVNCMQTAGSERKRKNVRNDAVSTIQLLLLAMSYHPTSAAVQENGAHALSSFAYKSPANILDIVSRGGLEILYLAAESQHATWTTHLRVCMTLYYIALYSRTGKSALQASRAADVARHVNAVNKDIPYASFLTHLSCE